MRTAVPLAVAVLLLAGCTGPDDTDATSDPASCLVESPDDYSCIEEAPPNGTQAEHLHDYWNGAERITVMDGPHTDIGPGYASGASFVVHDYRGDTHELILQGTQYVDITLTWTDDDLDRYSDPELWVQTAAQSEPVFVADLIRGEAVRMEIGPDDWDLPHQRLSAWVYQLRMSDAEEPPGGIRFKGDTNIKVEAERGLEIPLFPAHPDHWGNATEIPLFTTNHSVHYVQDIDADGCNGFSCPVAHAPDDSVIVPPGTDHVEVRLTPGGSPTTIALQYHGAETRQFARPTADDTDGDTQVYILDVDGDHDGPYALQSLWEFMVYISGPMEDGFVSESYTMQATAVKTGS